MGKRFLISRLSSLGDVVCTLPVATALKRGHPDSHVTWVVDQRFAGIVDCCTAVDEVVRVKPSFSPSSWPRYSDRFDAALDMQGLAKSAFCIARAKADQKLGYHWQREGALLFSSRVLPDKTSFHIVDQYVDVARAAGGEADFAEFALAPKPEDLASVRTKLDEQAVGAFVVMNPGAGWVTKRWPPEHFARLIDRLSDMNIRTVLIGGGAQADKDAAREVIDAAKSSPANLVGQTNVRELVALISLCKAHVGGDTGSTHIAAALGRPAIGLYSITRPQRSCPYGQVKRCHYNPEGLSNIEPIDVLGSVVEALA